MDVLRIYDNQETLALEDFNKGIFSVISLTWQMSFQNQLNDGGLMKNDELSTD